MDRITNEQIQHLAQYILDDYGSDLTDHRLTDAILLVLEDIAGFEMADDEAMNPILNQIREHYTGLPLCSVPLVFGASSVIDKLSRIPLQGNNFFL